MTPDYQIEKIHMLPSFSQKKAQLVTENGNLRNFARKISTCTKHYLVWTIFRLGTPHFRNVYEILGYVRWYWTESWFGLCFRTGLDRETPVQTTRNAESGCDSARKYPESLTNPITRSFA